MYVWSLNACNTRQTTTKAHDLLLRTVLILVIIGCTLVSPSDWWSLSPPYFSFSTLLVLGARRPSSSRASTSLSKSSWKKCHQILSSWGLLTSLSPRKASFLPQPTPAHHTRALPGALAISSPCRGSKVHQPKTRPQTALPLQVRAWKGKDKVHISSGIIRSPLSGERHKILPGTVTPPPPREACSTLSEKKFS